MAGARMTFESLMTGVGEKLTQIQQWQRELVELSEAAATESGSVAVEVDALGMPSRLWLDASTLRLQPAELGRLIAATFSEAATAVDGRRAEISDQLAAQTARWGKPGSSPNTPSNDAAI